MILLYIYIIIVTSLGLLFVWYRYRLTVVLDQSRAVPRGSSVTSVRDLQEVYILWGHCFLIPTPPGPHGVTP